MTKKEIRLKMSRQERFFFSDREIFQGQSVSEPRN
jgi:hypothetical protein